MPAGRRRANKKTSVYYRMRRDRTREEGLNERCVRVGDRRAVPDSLGGLGLLVEGVEPALATLDVERAHPHRAGHSLAATGGVLCGCGMSTAAIERSGCYAAGSDKQCSTDAPPGEGYMDGTGVTLADWLQAVFAGVLTLLTLFYVLTTRRQLAAMKEALKETRRSNAATEKSNEIAERSLELGRRALLVITGIETRAYPPNRPAANEGMDAEGGPVLRRSDCVAVPGSPEAADGWRRDAGAVGRRPIESLWMHLLRRPGRGSLSRAWISPSRRPPFEFSGPLLVRPGKGGGIAALCRLVWRRRPSMAHAERRCTGVAGDLTPG